jgi:phosphoribosyl-ATP pyrophosphohydrolase
MGIRSKLVEEAAELIAAASQLKTKPRDKKARKKEFIKEMADLQVQLTINVGKLEGDELDLYRNQLKIKIKRYGNRGKKK